MKHPVRYANETGCEFTQKLCTQNYSCNLYQTFIAPGIYQYLRHDGAVGLCGGQCHA